MIIIIIIIIVIILVIIIILLPFLLLSLLGVSIPEVHHNATNSQPTIRSNVSGIIPKVMPGAEAQGGVLAPKIQVMLHVVETLCPMFPAQMGILGLLSRHQVIPRIG